MSNINKKILIIGAGISGLSLAPLLAKQNYTVTIIDNNKQVGGVANRFKKMGFMFDTGPTWYLMPEVFEHYFMLFNKKRSDYYALKRLDPSYRVFFNSNDYVDIRNDLDYTKKIFDALEPGGGKQLSRYLNAARYKYETAFNEFLYKDYTSIRNFFNRKLIMEGTRLNIFRSLDSYTRKFFKSLHPRQILEFNTVFLGCSPYKSPALYSLMSHVDINQGVFYPEGGIYRLPNALQSLGHEHGVKYITETTVKKVMIQNRKAVGVETDHGKIIGDIIVMAGDYHHSETRLLESQYQSYKKKYWKKKTLAPTAFLLFLGLDTKIQNIQHHNLYLAPNWDEHFKTIFQKPGWPTEPCYYAGVPSQSDSTFAPANSESVFILVPVAPGLDDSPEIRNQFAQNIITHFEKIIGQDIQKHIIVKEIYSHQDYIDKYNLYQGTSMGLAHTLFQTAIFRPAHKSRKVQNLYYTGHYTHPGIGMPMVIISSQVVANRIKGDDK